VDSLRAQHLALEGYLNEIPLTEALIRSWFIECVERIGMTPYGEPVFWNYAGGWTAFQPIMESGLVVHQISQLLWVDIFSCKSFDWVDAFKFTVAHFGLRSARMQVIQRGMGIGGEL